MTPEASVTRSSLTQPFEKTSDQGGTLALCPSIFSERLCLSTTSVPVDVPEGVVGNFAAALKHSLGSRVEGISQIGHHVFNSLPELKLADEPPPAKFNSKEWYAQQFGNALGMIPSLLLVGGAIKMGLGKFAAGAETAESVSLFSSRLGQVAALTGESALTGFVFEGIGPVKPSSNESFWGARARNAAAGAVTFGVMGGTTGLIGQLAPLAADASTPTVRTLYAVGKAGFGGLVGGAVGAEANSYFHGGTWASREDVWQSAFGMAVVGGTLGGLHQLSREVEQSKLFSKAAQEAPKPPGFYEASKMESIDDIQRSRLSGLLKQDVLQKGEIVNVETREIGEYAKPMTFAEVVGANGERVAVVVRVIDPANVDPWTELKAERGQTARGLNQLIGFDNDAPASVIRDVNINGVPQRAYLEEFTGKPLIDVFKAMATKHFGEGATADRAVEALDNYPELKLAIEEALASRLLNGNIDFNPFNLTVPDAVPGERPMVLNVDEKTSFTPMDHNSWGRESIQEPMRSLRDSFAEKPMSEPIREKIDAFVRGSDTAHGRGQLEQIGLAPAEVDALLARARNLLEHGYPKGYWILDIKEFEQLGVERDAATKYLRENNPTLMKALEIEKAAKEARARAAAAAGEKPAEDD